MKTVLKSLSLLNWIFFRLPLAFSPPFTPLTLLWIFYGFSLTRHTLGRWILNIPTFILTTALPEFIAQFLVKNLWEFLLALTIVLLFFLGLLIAYNLSALLNWTLVWLELKPICYPTGKPYIFNPNPPADPEFADVDRIGIVLAGGGAKGTFQAGAMKAIYRYLDDKNALGKVKVIAGTSIGSWNALFWLADLIKPDNGWRGKSVHERWWQSISAKSLTAPSWYVPFLRNAFLSSLPWQQVFDHIFLKNQVVADRIMTSGMHFYFTRSNVMTGKLEYVTNNPNPPPPLSPGCPTRHSTFMIKINSCRGLRRESSPLWICRHFFPISKGTGGCLRMGELLTTFLLSLLWSKDAILSLSCLLTLILRRSQTRPRSLPVSSE